ncbi:uncharacterized protein LOC135145860 [Zophobas morio]|jgi:hypothetical protein|uniref:uncharacterized protein LOC135145860 n=1 Tax=Zophobas morio TaxID=2755281 RepID=UPI003082B629
MDGENDEEVVQSWIIDKLSAVDCQADSDVLAKYIIALLTSQPGKSEAELRKLCEDELYIFLSEDTQTIVSDLFTYLAKRSEKKVIANNIKQDTAKSVQSTSDFSIQSLVPDDSSVLSPNGDDDFTQGQAGFPSGGVEGEHVVYKNKDRSRLKDLEKAKTREHIRYAHRDKNKERYMYRDSERLRSASRYRERQRGELSPSQSILLTNFSSKRRHVARPCRDYEEQGYCIEGDRCAYDHGENPVVVNADTHSVPEVVQKLPPAIANRLPPALASRLSAQPPSSFDDEYKPESVLPQDLARELNNNYRSQAPLAPDGRSGSTANHHAAPKRFVSQDGKRYTAILELSNVPVEFNTLDRIMNHFKKFGPILNIHVRYKNNPQVARVQFKHSLDAKAAYSSPEAPFGNRFIKIYYAPVDDSGGSAVPLKTGGATSSPEAAFHPPQQRAHDVVKKLLSSDHGRRASLRYKRRVEEEKCRADALRQLQEMQKAKQHLVSENMKQQELILEKLQQKGITTAVKKELLEALQQLQLAIQSIKPAMPKVTLSKKELTRIQLDRQLEALSQERELARSKQESTRVLEEKLDDMKKEAIFLGLLNNGEGRISSIAGAATYSIDDTDLNFDLDEDDEPVELTE